MLSDFDIHQISGGSMGGSFVEHYTFDGFLLGLFVSGLYTLTQVKSSHNPLQLFWSGVGMFTFGGALLGYSLEILSKHASEQHTKEDLRAIFKV